MNSIENVAIIMDGNGRWAKQKLRPRSWGHIKGATKVDEIVTEAVELGVKHLTLYAFSTENWSRPKDEVQTIFKLFSRFLLRHRKQILKNNIRFNVIGDYTKASSDVVKIVDETIAMTKEHSGLELNIAFNYGSRAELVHAVNRFIKENPGQEISEDSFSQNLYNSEIAELDLVIRTGGNCRLSNFLLWQAAYAEIFFTDTLWPDFSGHEFREIIQKVKMTERRFGSLGESSGFTSSQALSQENIKRYHE